jgi:BASS family bile acid:Na+ symporter
MNAAALILLAAKVSILLTVFGLGLAANLRDAGHLFRRPGRLARSLLAMNLVMPLFAAALAAIFKLHPAVKIALIALAVSPVPPLLPKKELKAGGSTPYTIGLLSATALLAVVFVPVAVALLGKVFAIPARMPAAAVAELVLGTVLAPLAFGMAVRHRAPGFAARIARPIALAATVLLVVAVLPILFTAWPAIVSLIGNGTLAAIASFVAMGLLAGHGLGGPNPNDRTVLALSTASRHPGVALGIAHANFPDEKLAPAVVLLYLIASGVMSLPYLRWNRRRHAGFETGTGPRENRTG